LPEENPAQKPADQIQSQPIEPVSPKSDKPNWTDKTVTFFTLCLVVVAIVQGVIFYEQWQEMHSAYSLQVQTHNLTD